MFSEFFYPTVNFLNLFLFQTSCDHSHSSGSTGRLSPKQEHQITTDKNPKKCSSPTRHHCRRSPWPETILRLHCTKSGCMTDSLFKQVDKLKASMPQSQNFFLLNKDKTSVSIIVQYKLESKILCDHYNSSVVTLLLICSFLYARPIRKCVLLCNYPSKVA